MNHGVRLQRKVIELTRVWLMLSVVGQRPRRLARVAVVAATEQGLVEVARHALSTPGNPRIDLAHYPKHPQFPDGGPRPPKPKAGNDAEAAFLAFGPGAHAWLVEAAAAGAQRVRSKMMGALGRSYVPCKGLYK